MPIELFGETKLTQQIFQALKNVFTFSASTVIVVTQKLQKTPDKD